MNIIESENSPNPEEVSTEGTTLAEQNLIDSSPSKDAAIENSTDQDSRSLKFRYQLSLIQSIPLSPDNIDSYAERALLSLINLTDSVITEYKTQKPFHTERDKALEDNAFKYYGLNNIELILSHVSEIDKQIREIGEIIAKAEKIGQVIVPPQDLENPIQKGSGNFEKKLIIPRTKTLLFILANDFNLNINDPEQITLKTGELKSGMMRDLSYFMINAPKLNRTFLCCDEEGNATYVFDDSALKKIGISSEELINLTKAEINDLLSSNPKLGRRIIYSSEFVSKMIGLTRNLEIDENMPSDKKAGLYLYPNAPEEATTSKHLSKVLGVAQGTVERAIIELRDSLGETQKYKFGNTVTTGYTINQQKKIRQYLEKKGIFSPPAASDVLSASGLSEQLNVSQQVIRRAIEALGAGLGESRTFKFGPRLSTGYTPEQQKLIRQYLLSKGVLSERVPENILSTYGLANSLGISHGAVSKAIEELGDSLGEFQKFKFSTRVTIGLTLEQQNIIKKHLESKGTLTQQAPEGISSVNGFAKKLGVDSTTIERAIASMGPTLGEISQYRFGSGAASGLSPEQQEMIKLHLENKGTFLAEAPEGVLTAGKISERLGVSGTSVLRAIDELRNNLGITQNYRFGNTPGTGYTPAQISMVEQHLKARGVFSEKAPEDILTINGVAKKLGVSHGVVSQAVDQLGDLLGNSQKFIFGTKIAPGYTPTQQDLIEKYIKDKRS